MKEHSPLDSTSSALTPLTNKTFRNMWAAALISNIGGFMQNVGGAWYLTLSGTSAAWLGGLQAASTLPILFFGLFAGVLSDLKNRQTILLMAQAWQALCAFLLAYLTLSDQLSARWLILLTFLMNIGTAFHMPTWTAVFPNLVPPSELPAAVALSGLSINIARAIGPAMGGFLIGLAGLSVTFFVNALTFVLVFLVVLTWKDQEAKGRQQSKGQYLHEAKLGGVYAFYSLAFRSVLIRSLTTLFCAGSLWTLLPLVATSRLQLSSNGLGILLSCLGVGSFGGLLLMPRIRKRPTSFDQILTLGSGLFSLATLISGLSHSKALVVLALILGGFGWIFIMSTFNLCAQISVAKWIQARSLSIFLVTTQGALALGGLFWGLLAELIPLPQVLLLAGLLLAGQSALGRWLPLSGLQERDMTPYIEFAQKEHKENFKGSDGPIETQIIYEVEIPDQEQFLRALFELSKTRQRDGSYAWRVLWSEQEPKIFIESFLLSTWADHLRWHMRMTKEDKKLYERVHSFHSPMGQPIVTHRLCLSPKFKSWKGDPAGKSLHNTLVQD